MKKQSKKSVELEKILTSRGYPAEIAHAVAMELNTDFTADMMLGYLRYYRHPPLEDLADEMLAILDLRNRIVEKKKAEHYQQGINEMLNTDWDSKE